MAKLLSVTQFKIISWLNSVGDCLGSVHMFIQFFHSLLFYINLILDITLFSFFDL